MINIYFFWLMLFGAVLIFYNVASDAEKILTSTSEANYYETKK